MAPKWLRPEPLALPPALVAAAGSAALAELLYRRGLTTPGAVAAFLAGGMDIDEPGLPDLAAGVALLAEAVRARRRICVYGDYDTDGVTATTLLVSLLRFLGADVTFYVPNRFRDGYGMNVRAIEALAAEGTGLILTCDCGIRNLAEVRRAHELGMQVVVTDHHELGPELPAAEAVINPKRLPAGHSCRMLPGVGTAYLVARALLLAFGQAPDQADRWLDLVAVGIIADVVPLEGANRELARRGLARLNSSPCAGLQALMQAAGLQGSVTEEEVAFQVVPRLNAAGRLADASLGVTLLLTDGTTEAADLARQLDELNRERRRLTEGVIQAAAADAAPGAAAIILYRPEWHEGVLGIAAGKLAEERQVPVFLMARRHGGGTLVGSARAPEGLALHEVLDACSEHLVKHGGHAAAAGFSLLEDRLPALRVAILEEVRRRTYRETAAAYRSADLTLPFADAGPELYRELRQAAPYGEANPPPVLFSPGVKLLSSRPIGAGDKHLRLVLRDGENSLVGVWWGAGPEPLDPAEVDLFYRLSLNRYNGTETLQVVVEQVGEPVATVVREAPVLPRVRPELHDRRTVAAERVRTEFPGALAFAEGGALAPGTVDRYGVSRCEALVLLWPPPSPALFDELVALAGARQIVLAWPVTAPAWEDRFLPTLLQLLAREMDQQPRVSLYRLAVALGELESTVRSALEALAESHLLAIEEEAGDLLRLRRRTDGRGMRESHALDRMRRLLSESRAFRRFLRTGSVGAIFRALRYGV